MESYQMIWLDSAFWQNGESTSESWNTTLHNLVWDWLDEFSLKNFEIIPKFDITVVQNSFFLLQGSVWKVTHFSLHRRSPNWRPKKDAMVQYKVFYWMAF